MYFFSSVEDFMPCNWPKSRNSTFLNQDNNSNFLDRFCVTWPNNCREYLNNIFMFLCMCIHLWVSVWIREWVYVTVCVSLMSKIPNRSKMPSFLYYVLEEKAIPIFLDCAILFSDRTRGTQMERKKMGKKVFHAFAVRISFLFKREKLVP